VDKETLFAPAANTPSGMPEDDVPLPSRGGSVRVRGLSRDEALAVRGIKHEATAERVILSYAMVDPPMTQEEVGRWQKASIAGEMEDVTDKVSELSGLSDGAAKEVVKELVADPDAEFRALPGSEAGDAGVGPTAADE